MYSRSTLIIAAAAVVAATAASAGAAEDHQGAYGGSIKDNAIETILVPEAVEIPDTVSWYLRGDLSYGVTADVDVNSSVSGIVDPEGVTGFGVGFGRYLSPNTRLDFTFDYRRDEEVFNFSGQRTYNVTRFVDLDGNPLTAPQQANYQLLINDTDFEALASHMALVNFYYDFDRMGRFRPYVGGGIGIAIHEVSRRRQAVVTGCTGVDPNDPTIPVPDIGCGLLPQNDTDLAEADRNEEIIYGVGFAVAAHVGFSYELSDHVKLDAGYRVAFQSGDIATTVGINEISMGNRVDQEVRIGLRYDIW